MKISDTTALTQLGKCKMMNKTANLSSIVFFGTDSFKSIKFNEMVQNAALTRIFSTEA